MSQIKRGSALSVDCLRNYLLTPQPCSGSVAGLERSARVSENCNVLVHIPAATEDVALPTVFLLNLLLRLILEHQLLNFIDF